MVAFTPRKPRIQARMTPSGVMLRVLMPHSGYNWFEQILLYSADYTTLRAIQEFLGNRPLHEHLRQSAQSYPTGG